ncbi:MAG: SDR family oxidoreductase [Hyphomicrobiales bacterium]|nr:MAG: SDR family oxidoreductase [Hyphomicrobiales bacterium]
MEPSVLRSVILVTGSSSGLGRACADLLARSPGNIVYGASRSAPEVHDWTHMPMDVTDDAAVENGIAAILAREGRIDAVVHCAGMCVAGPIETATVAEGQLQFDTNYFGALRIIKAVLPGMRARRGGKIVLIGSIAGLISLPFQAHYSASKFALDGLTEALRAEIAPFGIEATVVHPGDYDTPFGRHRKKSVRSEPSSAYAEAFTKAMRFYEAAEQNGSDAHAFARHIERLLARKHLPAKAIVGLPLEKAGVWAKAVLPSRLFEQVFRLAYGP